jgi:acyl-CoA thioesterase-1
MIIAALTFNRWLQLGRASVLASHERKVRVPQPTASKRASRPLPRASVLECGGMTPLWISRPALPVFLCFLASLLITFMIHASDSAKRIVVLGDSIAAGYGVDPDEAYPAILQRKIDDAKLPYTVANAGLSGDTTAGGLRRIDWILKQPLDILIIELGGNDGLRGLPVSETRANLQAIIDRTRAKYPKAKILIAGMKMPANMGADYAADFEKTFADIAKKNKTAFVPFVLENVGGKAELNQLDRIHPTPAGHEIVAQNIWPILKPLLQ